MRIVTIAFIEPNDIKQEYHKGVPMGKISNKHLTIEVPKNIDAVFSGPNGDARKIIDTLLRDLDEYGSFCELTKIKLPK